MDISNKFNLYQQCYIEYDLSTNITYKYNFKIIPYSNKSYNTLSDYLHNFSLSLVT